MGGQANKSRVATIEIQIAAHCYDYKYPYSTSLFKLKSNRHL